MGRIMSFDQDGRMVADFDKSEHDFLCMYGRTPEEVLDENAKLREYAAKAWSLFIRHSAVHACDLSEVDAVRDGLRELGIEVDV